MNNVCTIKLCGYQFNFVGRLLGPRGNSLKRVEATTGCRVYIRGKGSIKDPDKVTMEPHHSLIIVFTQFKITWNDGLFQMELFSCLADLFVCWEWYYMLVISVFPSNLKEEKLRGRPGYEHLNEPLHILIEADLPANVVDIRLRQAQEIIEELLKPVVIIYSAPTWSLLWKFYIDCYGNFFFFHAIFVFELIFPLHNYLYMSMEEIGWD